MKICLVLCGVLCVLFYGFMLIFGKATVNKQKVDNIVVKAALCLFATGVFFLIFCLPIIGVTALIGFIIG